MNDHIPPLRPPDQMPPINDGRSLHTFWCSLMGELGFSERVLWLLFIRADGIAEPQLTQIAELPVYPEDGPLDGLGEVCARLLEGMSAGTTVATLLSRPGSATLTDSDRAWAACVARTARVHDVPMHPMHLANDEQVCVLAPDDLIGAR